MGNFGKTMSGLMAATLLAGAAAAPAEALGRWDRHHHHRSDKLSAGDVIGGLLLIGGIAAIASAAKDKGDDYGYGYGYSRGDRAKRDAVYACTNEAERGGGYEDARVRDITNVDRRDGVYRVRGVLDIGHVDSGTGIKSFTCYAKNGEIYNFELNDYRF